jgi:cysteine desulfurase
VRSYLDHASVSPLRPEVVEALGELLGVVQADPGRPYDEALVVRRLIEDARESVAGLVGARPRQVVFESSIAESATHVVSCLGRGGVVLASAASRQSVLESARALGQLEELAVDAGGHLRPDRLAERLAAGGVSMVSVQLANHETGVVDDVGPLIELAHASGALVHLDATMALGQLEVDLAALGADALTIGAELIGGPLGAAATVLGGGILLPPMLLGGAQERARRAGLENLMGIVGFGIAAMVLSDPALRSEERRRASVQRSLLEEAALAVEGVRRVGDAGGRLASISCLLVEGVEAEAVVMGLDRVGVSVHSGSACAAESLEPSPVLAAMGLDADHSMRLSVGWSTTDAEVERFGAAFSDVVGRLRALRS